MARGRIGHRPWGHLEWVLSSIDGPWSIIGCVSTEDRWVAVPRIVGTASRLGHHSFFRINPTGRGDQQAYGHTLIAKQRELATTLLGSDGEEHHLFERQQVTVDAIRRFTVAADANVIVDISCFPKRFFFPILKLVLEQADAKNVVVTYTHAGTYPSLTLSEDPEPESALPMFMGALPGTEPSGLIVAVGAESLGLSQVLEVEGALRTLRVLYPYPAPPPLGPRNAEFLRQMTLSVDVRSEDVFGIDPNDVPQTFARLQQLGGDAPESVALAPYGPKPVSLAMCLYVLSLPAERRPPVIYTQPKSYNPAYSSGIATREGRDYVTAYAVRLNGANLY